MPSGTPCWCNGDLDGKVEMDVRSPNPTQNHKAEFKWMDVELRSNSVTETHILENVPIFVFPVDLFLGIMHLFLVSSGHKILTNVSFQSELKVLEKNVRLIVSFHGRVNTIIHWN